MWWQLVSQVSFVLIVRGMHILQVPLFGVSTTGVNCIAYTNDRLSRMLNEGWGSHKPVFRKIMTKRSSDQPAFNIQPIVSRRGNTLSMIDNLIPRGEYLMKEHAKLVHDINSLGQIVYIKPIVEDKDYDDSIFPEIIEASPLSTSVGPVARPFASSARPYTSTKINSIPIILAGGASQRQVVKSQPINFAKPTVSLIGTTISPLIKHPYPFVVQRKPVKICVTALPPVPSSSEPIMKTLWQRLVDYFTPRFNFGQFNPRSSLGR